MDVFEKHKKLKEIVKTSQELLYSSICRKNVNYYAKWRQWCLE